MIPENSEFVISIKNLSKFKSSVTNNDYLNTVINSNLTVKNLISQLDKINDDNELLPPSPSGDHLPCHRKCR